MAGIEPYQAVVMVLNGGAVLAIGKWVYESKRDARRSLMLLKGTEEFEEDGVIPRLRQVEERTEAVEERAEENAALIRDVAGSEVDT